MAGSELKGASVAELQQELQRRQRDLTPLRRERDRLAAKVDELDKQIKALDGNPSQAPRRSAVRSSRQSGAKRKQSASRRTSRPSAGKHSPGRPRKQISLGEAMASVMRKDRAMSVRQIADAVQRRTNYKSNSKRFTTVVGQTLGKDKRFKRSGRGLYVRAR